MKINIQAQPTTYFEGVKVSSLPEETRYEIITLDNIIQQRNNKLLELEILEMALNHKMLLIKQNLVESGILKRTPGATQDEAIKENPAAEQVKAKEKGKKLLTE
jgi:hypothetical protein